MSLGATVGSQPNPLCHCPGRNKLVIVISSTEEVLFLLALVSLLAGLCISHSTSFPKIRWKGGAWATEETIGF